MGRVKKVVSPLEGSMEEVSVRVVSEKDRLVVRVLNDANGYANGVKPFSKLVRFYCTPHAARTFPMRNELQKFNSAKQDFAWGRAELQSFGNAIVATYRGRLERLKELRDKYSGRLQEVREGRVDVQEMKADYKEMSVLIFYLRKMMDVPWEDHTLPAVGESFQQFFVEVGPLCDDLTKFGGIIGTLSTAVRYEMSESEVRVHHSLAANHVPEIEKSGFQKFLDALVWFFTLQWLFSCCRSDHAVE